MLRLNILFKRPTPATFEEMAHFHDPDYMKFLENPPLKKSKKFNIGVGDPVDCPVFDGLFDFSQLSCGGSLGRFLILTNWGLGEFRQTDESHLQLGIWNDQVEREKGEWAN
jgi:hypothetical protein